MPIEWKRGRREYKKEGRKRMGKKVSPSFFSFKVLLVLITRHARDDDDSRVELWEGGGRSEELGETFWNMCLFTRRRKKSFCDDELLHELFFCWIDTL